MQVSVIGMERIWDLPDSGYPEYLVFRIRISGMDFAGYPALVGYPVYTKNDKYDRLYSKNDVQYVKNEKINYNKST